MTIYCSKRRPTGDEIKPPSLHTSLVTLQWSSSASSRHINQRVTRERYCEAISRCSLHSREMIITNVLLITLGTAITRLTSSSYWKIPLPTKSGYKICTYRKINLVCWSTICKSSTTTFYLPPLARGSSQTERGLHIHTIIPPYPYHLYRRRDLLDEIDTYLYPNKYKIVLNNN